MALAATLATWRRLAFAKGWVGLTALRIDLSFNPTLQINAMLTLYLLLSTCMLFAVGKSGAGLNYFVEWMAVLSVWIGTLVAIILHQELTKYSSVTGRIPRSIILLVPILLLMQVSRLPASRDIDADNPVQLQQLAELVHRIRNASKPVLSDDMVLLMKAGKEVPWEPAIFGELAAMGRWDEGQIVQMILDFRFEFVITRGYELFRPSVIRAIETADTRSRNS